MGVYVNKNIEEILETLKEWTEENREEERVIKGGDFNARTGEEGGRVEGEEEGEERKLRRSKDKKINGEGSKLCIFFEEQGWTILNGNIKGEERGEWTYTGGRGESVIDYVIGDEKTRRSRGKGRLGSSSFNSMDKRRREETGKEKGGKEEG